MQMRKADSQMLRGDRRGDGSGVGVWGIGTGRESRRVDDDYFCFSVVAHIAVMSLRLRESEISPSPSPSPSPR